MEPVLCELLEVVLQYLDPLDFGRLQRTSRSLLRATRACEENFLSRTRLVSVYRRAHVSEGQITFMWTRGGTSDHFKFEALLGARAILDQLWALKCARNDVLCTLFVVCELWNSDPVPCYLFKTDAAILSLQAHYGRSALRIDSGWPVWISCQQHPYRRCRSCAYPRRWPTVDMPVRQLNMAPAALFD